MLCDSNGLTHNFEVYTGRSLPAPTLPDVGASSNVVLRLIEHLPRQSQKKLLIYFDNWYSSPFLFVTLSNISCAALGPIRTRRLPGFEFTLEKDMKIESRRCKIAESLCKLEADPLKRGRPSTDKVEKAHTKRKREGQL